MKGLSKKIKNFQCNGLVVGNQGPLMKNLIFFFLKPSLLELVSAILNSTNIPVTLIKYCNLRMNRHEMNEDFMIHTQTNLCRHQRYELYLEEAIRR